MKRKKTKKNMSTDPRRRDYRIEVSRPKDRWPFCASSYYYDRETHSRPFSRSPVLPSLDRAIQETAGARATLRETQLNRFNTRRR